MKEHVGRVLVAGATGYLGRHVIKILRDSGADFCALARNEDKLKSIGLSENQIKVAEVTNHESLVGCCDNIDVVISCVGITRQKDGLRYMDVDFQANCNLLEEAVKSGVKKFIYVSALNAPQFRKVRLLNAKEKFADKLLSTKQLDPCIIRPNGFFSDLEEYYRMAQSGRSYVFGDGLTQMNPIHGEDLAHFCLLAVNVNEKELSVGGPQTLSLVDIAQLAFESQNRAIKVIHLPSWLRKVALLIASLLPERFGGAAEFFLTVCARDMIAPTFGEKTLIEHFRKLYRADSLK